MLLPSALSCEPSHSHRRSQTSSLFASPPASPPSLSSQDSFVGNIMNSCFSLQSLIAAAPASSTGTTTGQLPPPQSLDQLPTPPLAHTPSPMKLRLRSRAKIEQTAGEERLVPRKKVIKRAPAPTRGLRKRRRVPEDEMGRDDIDSESDEASDLESEQSGIAQPQNQEDQAQRPRRPSTPKRARIAPEQLPLGLERSDFHHVHLQDPEAEQEREKLGTQVEVEADGERWSAEDDRVLVELVLEKLKLSKTEWQDCARSLGRDRHSIGRRWKSLMLNGDVGVKRRRAKLHATWR